MRVGYQENEDLLETMGRFHKMVLNDVQQQSKYLCKTDQKQDQKDHFYLQDCIVCFFSSFYLRTHSIICLIAPIPYPLFMSFA